MIRYLIPTFFSCLTLAACGQTNNQGIIKGVIIDPGIKSEVEKYIEPSKEFDTAKTSMQIYENAVFIEAYQNDSLTFSSTDKNNKQLFKSFYLWKGDTLTIDGAFGLFGGVGFGINIYKNNAT